MPLAPIVAHWMSGVWPEATPIEEPTLPFCVTVGDANRTLTMSHRNRTLSVRSRDRRAVVTPPRC